MNGATVTNKGVELSGNVRPYHVAELDVTIGGNYAKNQGKVVSLLEGVQFVPYNNEGFTGAIGSSTVGYAPGVLRGQDSLRCGYGQTSRCPAAGRQSNVDAGPQCGREERHAVHRASAIGQPVVNPDEQVIADPNPKWTAGVNGGFAIGRFQFSTLFDIRRGGQVWDGTRSALDRFGTSAERRSSHQHGRHLRTERAAERKRRRTGRGQIAFKTPSQWQTWFTALAAARARCSRSSSKTAAS